MSSPPHRVLDVPALAAGMRLDQFLARRFRDRSRSSLVRGIRAGQVRDANGQRLRASSLLRGDERLQLSLPGIAPSGPAPSFPAICYQDSRLAVIAKPAGLLCHPAGTDFVWSVIGLARERWPDAHVDLIHRLDRETSGALLIGKDPDATRFLKAAIKQRRLHKEYEALLRGLTPWQRQEWTGPIGPADGPIRIQMAVRPDGQQAHTSVEVIGRRHGWTRVRLTLHTGRTHQIRVHAAHAGFPLLGDKLYGTPAAEALAAWDAGSLHQLTASAGAPRQALHAARIRFPHPEGGEQEVEAPWPPDLVDWWQTGAPLS